MSFQIVIDALTRIITDIVNFIPNLINGLIILFVGYLIARVVQWILRFALKHLRVDPLVERTGITGAMRGLGVKMPMSELITRAVYFLLLLSFLITSTRLMGLEAVASLLQQVLVVFPKVIAGAVVFLLGGIAARFMGDLITTMATGAGISYARRLGAGVQYLVSLFVAVIALGVLGVDTSLLVTAVTIVIAAFGLGLALAFGLGARNIVEHILAGYYLRQRFGAGQAITYANIEGQVSGIGGVNTRIETANGAVLVPNTTLLESVVGVTARPQDTPHAS